MNRDGRYAPMCGPPDNNRQLTALCAVGDFYR